MTKANNTGRRARILDMQGRVINPDPPSGLYVVGNCQICQSPLFYHGGGEYIQEHLAGPNTVHMIPEQLFSVCDCPVQQVEIQISPEYNLLAERQAVMMLIGAYNKLRHLNTELAQTLHELTRIDEPEPKPQHETVAYLDESNEWVVENVVRAQEGERSCT